LENVSLYSVQSKQIWVQLTLFSFLKTCRRTTRENIKDYRGAATIFSTYAVLSILNMQLLTWKLKVTHEPKLELIQKELFFCPSNLCFCCPFSSLCNACMNPMFSTRRESEIGTIYHAIIPYPIMHPGPRFCLLSLCRTCISLMISSRQSHLHPCQTLA